MTRSEEKPREIDSVPSLRRPDATAALRDAVREIRRLRSELAKSDSSSSDPVAVVSMACRLPGGVVDPESYLDLLREGRNAIQPVPTDRWQVPYNHLTELYTNHAGYLDDVSGFDPDPFGISPREAKGLDPQQRLLLEVTLEAIERAGLMSNLQGSDTGVYVGMSTDDYAQLSSESPDLIDAWNSLGTMRSVAAGRIAYTFGLQGPALLFDTSCSSSLVAIHNACRDLRDGTVSAAIAGGVNLILSPRTTVGLCRLQALSPDGLCRTFDADANGYVRGEGCGVVVLKRLNQAIRDNDPILAVIRGSAINHDGKSNGLTAPNGQLQERLLKQALDAANLSPDQIQYLEAHGTGTALGDPIEVNALGKVYGPGHSKASPLRLGSVKPNIGHLEAAAGVAGFIKTVLSLQYGEFYPHPHFKTPNPHIPWERLPFSVPNELQPWDESDTERRAAISAFGMSGTNVHLLLEEWTRTPRNSSSLERPYHLLALSAQTDAALGELVERYGRLLGSGSSASLEDLCSSTNTGRLTLEKKAAFVAESNEDMHALLSEWSPRVASEGLDSQTPPRIGFLFTGQGSQYQSMGRELYGSHPVFTETMDRCNAVLQPVLGKSIRSLIDTPELLNQTRYTQPVLFSLECALYKLWESWGVTPSAVLGHSLGEYSAAWAAGVFDLESGLELIAERARLMQSMPGDGSMAAVLASEQIVRQVLSQGSGDAEIAALNGPNHVVISGQRSSVEAAAAILDSRGVACKTLDVSHAFHSSQMDNMLSDFEGVVGKFEFRDPDIPMASNLTGDLVTSGEIGSKYWSAHTRGAVRFTDGMQSLREAGCDVFLEIGPRPVLLGMAESMGDTSKAMWLPSLRPGTSDWKQLLHSLSELYVRGVSVDLESVDRGYGGGGHCTLPSYPFQRRSFWLDRGERPTPAGREETENTRSTPSPDLYTTKWVPALTEQSMNAPQPDPPNERRNSEKAWILYTPNSGSGENLPRMLGDQGCRCIKVSVGLDFERVSASEFRVNPVEPEHTDRLFRELADTDVAGVLHAWNLRSACSDGSDVTDLAHAAEVGCASLLHLMQSYLAEDRPAIPIWVLTAGAHSVANEDTVDPVQSIVWGLGKVIGQEHPETRLHFVDLDPTNLESHLNGVVERAITDHPFSEAETALRKSTVYVPRLRNLPVAPGDKDSIHEDATYLITGGLSGVGLESAQWLVDKGATSIVLLGRSVPTESAKRRIETMSATARIEILQGDVSKREDVERVVTHIRSDLRPLKGIIHSAGVYDDRLVVEHKWELFDKVFSAKIYGTWNLHQATLHDGLDFLVSYSSAASMLGVAGLANYVAANTFLDAFSAYRRARALPGLTVCWGPWDNIGMARKVGAERQVQWKSAGVSPLTAQDYRQGLEMALMAGSARVGVFSIDWAKFVGRSLDTSRTTQLSELIDLTIPGSGESPYLEELRSAEPALGPAILVGQVRSFVLAVLEIDSPSQLPNDKGFFEIGMDSLMALELINRINQVYGCKLAPTAVFRHPTVSELATHLVDVLQDDLVSSDASPLAPGTPRVLSPTPAGGDEKNAIAIVGMGCRFPGGSDSPEKFWELLCEGRDAIVPYPSSRWDAGALFDPDPNRPGKIAATEGGYLDQVDLFDPAFFGISPKEATSLDPQQRLLLEVSWETLERAGIPPSSLRGSDTGVFVGIGQSDYARWKLNAGDLEAINAYDGTGTGLCFAAGRISHTLGLQGPSMIVDTACSSSLVSVHLACQSLLQGECSTALAGGGHLNLSPEINVFLSRTGALSPDGRCKAFDSNANGFGRGEGVGMVLLKRVADAHADGNPILAVIRGSATNHDGPSSGLTVPNQNAQESLLRESLDRSNVDPADVGYVEAHGTGTILGDPIEVESLSSVYGNGRPASRPLYIGSVKSNFGHLEPAAGIAGLIKCALSLQHGVIPKHLHFKEPNPHIAWDGIPVRVASESVDWSDKEQPRYAGVSSFGMSGTNAHIILQSAPHREQEESGLAKSDSLLVLSAKSEQALRDLSHEYTLLMAHRQTSDISDLCRAAATGRDHHPHRLAIVARSRDDLNLKLHQAFSDTAGPDTFRSATAALQEQEAGLHSIAGQYVNGVDIDWTSVFGIGPHLPELPTYPFQRSRFWVEGSPFKDQAGNGESLYYKLNWKPMTLPSANRGRDLLATWIIVADQDGAGDAFTEVVTREGCRAITIKDCAGKKGGLENALSEEISRASGGKNGPVRVVYLSPVDEIKAGVPQDTRAHAETVLEIAQQLPPDSETDCRLWIVTRGAQPVEDTAGPVNLQASALWGMGKSLALEFPDRWSGIVDLDPQKTAQDQTEALWQILSAGCPENQFARRDGVTFVPTVDAIPRPSTEPLAIAQNATYAISGGLGGLGLQTARWLASRGARNLVLFGRRGIDENSKAPVADLEAQGVRVKTSAVDITDEAAVRALMDSIGRELPPLRGVIHAAGVPGVSPLNEIDRDKLQAVLAPKVEGAVILDTVTKDLDLDFFVLYSSIASVWGSKRQTHYAAANSFLDAFASERRARQLRTTSISWGLVEGTGLVSESDREALNRMGIDSLDEQQVAEALDHLIGSTEDVAVANVDWSRLCALFESTGNTELVSHLNTAKPDPASYDRQSDVSGEWRFLDRDARSAFTLELVSTEARNVLGMSTDQELDIALGFFEMGMDSMMAVDLRRRLEQQLHLELPASVIFDQPTASRLAKFLNSSILEGYGVEHPSENGSQTDTSGAVGHLEKKPKKNGETGSDDSIDDRLNRLENLLRQV